MNEQEQSLIRIGSIVQLHPEKCRNIMFAACLLTVTEIKSWGVQGYVQSLGENEEMGGQAYLRPTWKEILFTGGMSPFMPEHNLD